MGWNKISEALGLGKDDDKRNIEDTEDGSYEVEDFNDNGSKMILVEPRANSESQQIADQLKKRNSVVVNLKRVTSDQSRRIIDFLSGTLYAIGGEMQKLGNGIYLCTPKNVNVEGRISDEDDKNNKRKIEDEMDF